MSFLPPQLAPELPLDGSPADKPGPSPPFERRKHMAETLNAIRLSVHSESARVAHAAPVRLAHTIISPTYRVQVREASRRGSAETMRVANAPSVLLKRLSD